MTNGSFNEDDVDRPKWGEDTEKLAEYIYKDENGEYQFEVWKGKNKEGDKCFQTFRANDLSMSDRAIDRDLEADYFPGYGPRWPDDKPAKIVLYRLHDLLKSTDTVFLVEGEKDVETLFALGLTATCNPFGALKWCDEFSAWLKDRDVVILQDNDERGAQHARKVLKSVRKVAASVKRILLPGLPEKGDVTDWLGIDGNTKEKLLEIVAAAFAKPVIHVVAGELHRYVEEAEAALLVEDIYQRGGELVRPYTDNRMLKGETVKFPCVTGVTAAWLNSKLSADATFLVYDGRAKKEVSKNPPPEVATTILSRVGEWQFPTLAGVINTPTMRPDGSILSAPGYDRATGLFLFNPLEIPDIPETPTKEDCIKAINTLNELINEVPFVINAGETKEKNASRSVALSMLMTPVLRPALSATPFHLVSAPQAGTGKTYLTHLASLIFNGDRLASIVAGTTNEETEKRLSAAALEGHPLICIDNCNRIIKNIDFLCHLTENPFVKPRILGKSEAPSIPNKFVVFGTGNNTGVAGDLCRRTVICHLDANLENTTTRPFKKNPVEMIHKDRGKYVAAILTIAKGIIAATDYEKPVATLSYADWSNIVRSALMWLDCADPWMTAASSLETDPETVALKALAAHWPSPGKFLTATELSQLAFETVSNDKGDSVLVRPDLRQCLITLLEAKDKLKFDAQTIGNVLSPLVDRRVGDQKFKRDDRSRYFWRDLNNMAA